MPINTQIIYCRPTEGLFAQISITKRILNLPNCKCRSPAELVPQKQDASSLTCHTSCLQQFTVCDDKANSVQLAYTENKEMSRRRLEENG